MPLASRPSTLLPLLLLLTSLTIGAAFDVSAGACARLQRDRKLRTFSPDYCCPACLRTTSRVMEGAGEAKSASFVAAAAASPGGACDERQDTPLFVYGTLMNHQVLSALLDRVPSTKRARLAGYHRYRIKDHVFPAIRPREGGSVSGLLMTGLDAREKLIFDLFEDEDYHKVDVEVTVEAREDDKKRRTATSYVWNASAEDQLYGTWEPSTHFTEEGPVPAYVGMVKRFAKEIQEKGLLKNEGDK